MCPVTDREGGLGGCQAVIRHARSSALVDGVRMVMMWQPFQPVPVRCGKRINDSHDPQMIRTVQYRQLTHHRPQQGPRGGWVAAQGDGRESFECQRDG